MTDKGPKLCVECAFYKGKFRSGVKRRQPACGHPDWSSFVDGEALWDCEIMRNEKSCCGKDAILFEPKPPRKRWLDRFFARRPDGRAAFNEHPAAKTWPEALGGKDGNSTIHNPANTGDES